MSKDFAMLNAARKLENYLSREYYNLSKMEKNDRIPFSLFETKVGHYNELVGTLNDFFGELTESKTSQLFTRYGLDGQDSVPDMIDGDIPDMSVESPGYDAVEVVPELGVMKQDPVKPEPVRHIEKVEVAESKADTQSEAVEETKQVEEAPEPTWVMDGYNTREAWLADKDAENAASPDDLSIGVNTSLSQHRVGQALDEYRETSEQDIAFYDPEDDTPTNVLPSDSNYDTDLREAERPTENLSYLNHTVDNVRVDNDPTQIVGVETAVERDGESARRGTDIDVSSFVYQSKIPVIDDLISDEIMKLRPSRDDSNNLYVEKEDEPEDEND